MFSLFSFFLLLLFLKLQPFIRFCCLTHSSSLFSSIFSSLFSHFSPVSFLSIHGAVHFYLSCLIYPSLHPPPSCFPFPLSFLPSFLDSVFPVYFSFLAHALLSVSFWPISFLCLVYLWISLFVCFFLVFPLSIYLSLSCLSALIPSCFPSYVWFIYQSHSLAFLSIPLFSFTSAFARQPQWCHRCLFRFLHSLWRCRAVPRSRPTIY